MFAAVYMANNISPYWDTMSSTFNLAMLVMLLCVGAMYFIQIQRHEQDTGAAKNSLLILTVVCLLYLAAFADSAMTAGTSVIGLDVAAVLTGAFLPFFIRGNFDVHIISFPHLMERFELITIITFGEAVVGMTDFFDVRNFSVRPVLIFATLLALFGCYVTQIHYLCDHHRVERGLRLMFSHYFIVIAVNLITVAFKLLENPASSRHFTATLMIVATALFFIALYTDSAYNFASFHFRKRDMFIAALWLIVGAAFLLASNRSMTLFLMGALLAAGGNLTLLLAKLKHVNILYRHLAGKGRGTFNL